MCDKTNEPRYNPLTKGKYKECTEYPCTWWRGKYGIYECIFGSCFFTEEERKSGIIKYNSIERRFYGFLRGKPRQKKNRCYICGKKWKAGFYCPKCAKSFPVRGGCRHG